MNDQKRLFFGFEVKAPWPEDLPKGRILQESQRHITVAFLGETSYEKVRELIDEMPKPSFKVGTVGTFDVNLFLPEGHPRVVAWRGNPLGNDFLTPYSDALNDFFRSKEYSIQKRPFLNHTTIARSPFDQNAWEKAFLPLPYMTGDLHLYESAGNLNYKPIWSYPLPAPFEEFEHVADIAFRIHGENVKQLYYHAQIALAFECPDLVPYLDRKEDVQTLEEVIMKLNEIVSRGDREIGTPFKAVSYHGELKEDEILTWEMIVDV